MNVKFWNTLATHDLERARAFYTGIGFTVRDMPMPGGITVVPTEGAMVCLFLPDAFKGMIAGEICDTARAQEVVQSISVATKEELEALAAKVEKAGGRVVGGEPKPMPWGHVVGFADPDGHVWSVLWFSHGG